MRKGFTIIELMVSICIIIILISILLPAFGRIREEAKRVQCLTQMHNIGNGFFHYLKDNRDFYPAVRGYNSWIAWEQNVDFDSSAVGKYLDKPLSKQTFRCPSDELFESRTYYHYSYALNSQFVEIRSIRINAPASKVMLTDDKYLNDATLYFWAIPANGYPEPLNDGISLRHGKTVKYGNVIFADGHGESWNVEYQNDANWYLAYPSQPLQYR